MPLLPTSMENTSHVVFQRQRSMGASDDSIFPQFDQLGSNLAVLKSMVVPRSVERGVELMNEVTAAIEKDDPSTHGEKQRFKVLGGC